MLTGLFLSDQPALKFLWGDANLYKGTLTLDGETRSPYNLSTGCSNWFALFLITLYRSGLSILIFIFFQSKTRSVRLLAYTNIIHRKNLSIGSPALKSKLDTADLEYSKNFRVFTINAVAYAGKNVLDTCPRIVFHGINIFAKPNVSIGCCHKRAVCTQQYT